MTPIGELEALRWLKDATKTELGPSAEVEARLRARVSESLAVLSFGLGGANTAWPDPDFDTPDTAQGDGLSASANGRLDNSGASNAATAFSDSGSLPSGTWRQLVASRLALWSAPALVIGAAAGVAGHAALARTEIRTIYVERTVPAQAAVQEVPKVESLALEPEPPVMASTSPEGPVERTRTTATSPKAPAVASAEPRNASPLSRERAVLDPARAALAAGDPARALEQTRRHAREFPSGILSEEREAIAINALVSLGNYAQASKRAATFRMRFPQSLMMHMVDAAMATTPRE